VSKKNKREVASYIEAAKRLAVFAPSLRKYKRRKRLNRWEKASISRKENVLKFAHNLHPINKRQARKLKEKLFAPGIQAIELRNTSEHAKVAFVRDDLFITSNGRTWLYWDLNKFTKTALAHAGEIAFHQVRQAFPIEKIAELAERAFKKPKTKEVYLWATSGRVGDGFYTLEEFMDWLAESYGGYNEPQNWIRGLAIRL
jgi:hypothetical protein